MDSAQQLTAQMTLLERQSESLKMNLDFMQSHLRELMIAKETMDNIRQAENGQEILFPLGAGCFVAGQVNDIEKVIVNIGSDVSVKQDIEKGISTIDARIEDVKKLISSTSASLSQVRDRMNALESQARALIQQQQSEKR